MSQVLLPDLSYEKTALRPEWAQLPAALREAIEARLGAQVTEARVNRCGFTPGFAAVTHTADGETHFVKAVTKDALVYNGYVQEARIAANLPSPVPAARLRWSAELAGHMVLCFDPIAGARTPALPWVEAELHAALEAVAIAVSVLATHEEPAAKPFAVALDTLLNKWRTGKAPQDHPHHGELVALEARFDELTREGGQLIHCDLRLDNVVIDGAGKAWICDWSSMLVGPAWFDVISLLLSGEASGFDVDALFAAQPVAADLPADALDAALAAFLGYYRYSSRQPGFDTSPNLRTHQAYYGDLTWRWLARRQGWG